MQAAINSLDVTKLLGAVEKLGATFQQENSEVIELINEFKDLGIVK